MELPFLLVPAQPWTQTHRVTDAPTYAAAITVVQPLDPVVLVLQPRVQNGVVPVPSSLVQKSFVMAPEDVHHVRRLASKFNSNSFERHRRGEFMYASRPMHRPGACCLP